MMAIIIIVVLFSLYFFFAVVHPPCKLNCKSDQPNSYNSDLMICKPREYKNNHDLSLEPRLPYHMPIPDKCVASMHVPANWSGNINFDTSGYFPSPYEKRSFRGLCEVVAIRRYSRALIHWSLYITHILHTVFVQMTLLASWLRSKPEIIVKIIKYQLV